MKHKTYKVGLAGNGARRNATMVFNHFRDAIAAQIETLTTAHLREDAGQDKAQAFELVAFHPVLARFGHDKDFLGRFLGLDVIAHSDQSLDLGRRRLFLFLAWLGVLGPMALVHAKLDNLGFVFVIEFVQPTKENFIHAQQSSLKDDGILAGRGIRQAHPNATWDAPTLQMTPTAVATIIAIQNADTKGVLVNVDGLAFDKRLATALDIDNGCFFDRSLLLLATFLVDLGNMTLGT